jgi:rubrerythrin
VALLHLKRRALDEGHRQTEDEWQEAIRLAERADAAAEAGGEIERVQRLAQAEGLHLTFLEEASWRCPYCGHLCLLGPAG